MLSENEFELADGLDWRNTNAKYPDGYEGWTESEKAVWLDQATARDHHLTRGRARVTGRNIGSARVLLERVPHVNSSIDPGSGTRAELAQKIVPGCEVWLAGSYPMVIWPDDRGAISTSDGVEYGTWQYPLNWDGWHMRGELVCKDFTYDPRGSWIPTSSR